MCRLLVLAFALGSLLNATPAVAQDAQVPQTQKREAGTYYRLFQFEFHPGKTDDALNVLYATLVPAWRRAGVQVLVIESLLQTKDVLLLIELKDGPNALAYTVPEQDAKAWAALLGIAGDAEAANSAVDRFVGDLTRHIFLQRAAA